MGNLTLKQQGFVKDYLETGNASLAVRNNYNTQDDATARAIGSENLTKHNIQRSIKEALEARGLSNDHLASKVAELVNAQKITRIIRKGEIELVREELDTQAVKTGLEFAFKLKNIDKGQDGMSISTVLDQIDGFRYIVPSENAVELDRNRVMILPKELIEKNNLS